MVTDRYYSLGTKRSGIDIRILFITFLRKNSEFRGVVDKKRHRVEIFDNRLFEWLSGVENVSWRNWLEKNYDKIRLVFLSYYFLWGFFVVINSFGIFLAIKLNCFLQGSLSKSMYAVRLQTNFHVFIFQIDWIITSKTSYAWTRYIFF